MKDVQAAKLNGKQKKRIILFVIEIIVILLMMGALWMVMEVTETPSGEGPKVVKLDTEELSIPEQVQEEVTMKGYRNIALFGVDAVTDSQLYKSSRSDCTIVANVNMDTGEIKLVSVYRDTYLNDGTDDYGKCNQAYSYGGAEQAVKMLNMNLDLDIEDFITVGYQGLSEVIDGLGGVYVEVDSEELKHINNYQITIADVLQCSYTAVEESGYQLLNGLQATAYCRIRATRGDDFKRTERQREVLKAIEVQAKKADLSTLTSVFQSAMDDIYTSVDSKDVLDLLANIAQYSIVEEAGFPEESMRTVANIGAVGSSIIPTDLESNVIWLHQFLFEDESYSVSETVKEIDQTIAAKTSGYLNSR